MNNFDSLNERSGGRLLVVLVCVLLAGLPLSANVQFLTVMATRMPFIGRG